MAGQLSVFVRRVADALRAVTDRVARDPSRAAVLAVAAVTLAFVVVPLSPTMPGAALDDAWALGMNEALAQGRVFGRDIVFTFGPYAALFSTAYHPATDALMLLAGTYLAGCYWFAIVVVTADARRYLPSALVVVLVVFVSGRDARDALLMSYPLLVGLACYRIAMRPVRSRHEAVVVGILAAPFGLLALVKGSMSVACALVCISVLGVFAVRRRGRLAAVLVAAPVVGLVAWWLLAGQPIGALPSYALSFLPIMADYADAMAIPGDGSEVIAFVVGCAVLVTVVLLDRDTPRWPRLCHAGIYVAFLFVALKAGFVRHDSHALIPAYALLIAATVVVGTQPSRLAPIVGVAAFAVWLLIDRGHLRSSVQSLATRVAAVYVEPLRGLGRRLTGPWPETEFHASLTTLGASAGLPVLDGTTDVYSFGQTGLIASGNRWSPRPVFQSYAAYDEPLAARNRAHLSSVDAPDNVLFRIEPIDARLPALDDGASWPALLTRYRPTAFDRGLLTLRRRTAQGATHDLETVARVTARIGRRVDVPVVDGLVFAELVVQPSVLGRIAGAVFKSNTLLIHLTLANGQLKTYRHVARLGAAGVMLSPLVETTADFVALYATTTTLDAKRVTSFRIAPAGTKRLWQPSYEVTFKRLAPAPVLGPRPLHALVGEVPLDAPIAGGVVDHVLDASGCDGVIDRINGYGPPPGEIAGSGLLAVSGWIVRDLKAARLPVAVVLVLTDAGGVHTLYRTRRVPRPDVATYFGDPRLEGSGYETTIDASALVGTYGLTLGFEDAGRVELCPRFPYKVTLRPPAAIAQ